MSAAKPLPDDAPFPSHLAAPSFGDDPALCDVPGDEPCESCDHYGGGCEVVYDGPECPEWEPEDPRSCEVSPSGLYEHVPLTLPGQGKSQARMDRDAGALALTAILAGLIGLGIGLVIGAL